MSKKNRKHTQAEVPAAPPAEATPATEQLTAEAPTPTPATETATAAEPVSTPAPTEQLLKQYITWPEHAIITKHTPTTEYTGYNDLCEPIAHAASEAEIIANPEVTIIRFKSATVKRNTYFRIRPTTITPATPATEPAAAAEVEVTANA